MFMGSFEHSLDPKNRLFVPAAFRDELGESFVICRAPENCLFIYSNAGWEKVVAPLHNDGPTTLEDRRRQRRAYANAAIVTIDGKGRITVPQKFCDHAQFDKNVVLIGQGNRIEVWNADKWNEELDFCDEMDETPLSY